MANPLFDKLKEAFASNPERWLEDFGFLIGGRGDDILRTDHTCDRQQREADSDFCTWWVDTGNFECKKCGEKSTDITDSYRIIKGLDGDHAMTEAAQALATDMGVPFTKYDPKKKKDWTLDLPNFATPDFVKEAQRRLMGEEGVTARKFIETKWKVDPAEVSAEVGLGLWMNKKSKKLVLIFPQFDECSGELSPRFRYQEPDLSRKTKRFWNTEQKGQQKQRAPRLYPQVKPGDMIEEFVLLEGESDLITARCRLDLPGMGVYPIALGMGKSSLPEADHFPTCMDGKKVTIIQDLDAFQGRLDEIKGTDVQKSTVRGHTTKALWNLCKFLRERNCEVHLSVVDLDPCLHPTGDLSDWVNAGGRSLSELRTYTYDEVYGELDKVQVVATVDEALNCSSYQRISIIGTVAGLREDAVSLPRETIVTCAFGDVGMASACNKCGLPSRLSAKDTNLVPWERFTEEYARTIFSSRPDSVVVNDVCQKAGGCTRLAVRHSKANSGCKWLLADAGAVQGTSQILVISEGKSPPIVGRVEVTGRVFPLADGSIGMVAEPGMVKELDANTVDIDPFKDRLLHSFPHHEDDLERLTAEIERIAVCVSDHVTGGYNRKDLHIGTLITLCSVLWFLHPKNRKTKRGWMDISIMGKPRQGKSITVTGIFDALGMGFHCQAGRSSTSVPGLTSSSADKKTIQPGIWPKHHGRAVALDEMQTYFNISNDVIAALQSARSDGYVDTAKCTGPGRMDAAVRAIYISNFPSAIPSKACQALAVLFDNKREAISRLDFPLFVKDAVAFEPAGVPNSHPIDLIRVVVQRAWSQEPHEIKFEEGAFEVARDRCLKWEEIYDEEEIPLFSGEEKAESVMRIAIGVANLVFSFESADPTLRTVEVRKVHVEWALQWLEHCWSEADYRSHSDALMRQHRVVSPMVAQAILVSGVPAVMAEATLGPLLDTYSDSREAESMMRGDDFRERSHMFAQLKRHNVLRTTKVAGRLEISPTNGGKALIERIIELAVDDEELFDKLTAQWANWNPVDGLSASAPPDFTDQAEYDLFRQNEGMW